MENKMPLNNFQLFNEEFDAGTHNRHNSNDHVLNGDHYDAAGYDNDDLESSDESEDMTKRDFDTASGLQAHHYHATLEDSGDETKDAGKNMLFESEESMSCSSDSSNDPTENKRKIPHEKLEEFNKHE
jgi:hypothetical protein